MLKTLISYKVERVTNKTNSAETMLFLQHGGFANNLSYRFYYHLYIIALTYVIPLIVLSVMNYLLVMVLCRARALKHRLGLRERNEQKSTIILIMLVILFFFCQLPNFFLHILQATDKRLGNSEVAHTYFIDWARFLLLLNSSYNFIVYCALNEEFREDAKNIFTCYQRNGYIDEYNRYRQEYGGRRNTTLKYVFNSPGECITIEMADNGKTKGNNDGETEKVTSCPDLVNESGVVI